MFRENCCPVGGDEQKLVPGLVATDIDVKLAP